MKWLMVAKKIEYLKDEKKNWFESNDGLPLNKSVKPHLLTIIIRCLFLVKMVNFTLYYF